MEALYLTLAERCGKAGLIDEQIAIMLGIAVSTYYLWLNEHPEFSEALKRGQTNPGARTKNTLYQRANGMTVPEEKVFLHEGQPVKVQTWRYIPPSDTALIFWLCNKLPEEFKHVQHIQNAGAVDLNHKGTVPAGFLSDMNRTLAAMGERPPAATSAAPQPAPAARRPPKAAPLPESSEDMRGDPDEDEDIPLSRKPQEEDPNPPSALDLSDLEGDDG